MSAPTFGVEAFGALDIDRQMLYSALRLRSEVFVVEQNALYLDMDNRDLLSTTTHVLALSEGHVVGNLRLVEDGGATRFGRMCVAYRARGHGVARALLNRSLKITGTGVVDTHTQVHLAPWYESFGFVTTGPVFNEVGIPHVPMRRVAP